MGGCTHTKMHTLALFSRESIAFTKLSANVEQLVGFIKLYSNCDGSLKGRCSGNRFAARVSENWHTTSSFLALAFHSG